MNRETMDDVDNGELHPDIVIYASVDVSLFPCFRTQVRVPTILDNPLQYRFPLSSTPDPKSLSNKSYPLIGLTTGT